MSEELCKAFLFRVDTAKNFFTNVFNAIFLFYNWCHMIFEK